MNRRPIDSINEEARAERAYDNAIKEAGQLARQSGTLIFWYIAEAIIEKNNEMRASPQPLPANITRISDARVKRDCLGGKPL